MQGRAPAHRESTQPGIGPDNKTFPARLRVLTLVFVRLLGVSLAAAVIILVALYPPDQYFDAQTQISGARAVLQGQSPYRGAYVSPFWAAFFVLPFAALPDALGFPLWFWAVVGAWLVTAIVLVRTCRPDWGWWPSLSTGVLLLIFPPVIWSIHGQLDYLLGLGLAGFLGWAQSRPRLAGASLSLLSVKPHLAVLLVPLLLMWAVRQRKGQALLGFVTAMGGLVLAAFLVQPGWLAAWAGALLNLPAEIRLLGPEFSPTTQQFLRFWFADDIVALVSLSIAVTVAAVALQRVWRARPVPSPVTLAVVGTSAVFLVTPYAQGYDLSLLLVPLIALGTRALPPRRWMDWGLLLGAVAVFLLPVASGVLRWPQPVLLVAPMLCLALFLFQHQSGEEPA